MKVTRRGRVSIAALIALGFSAVLFLDIVVFSAFVIVFSILISSLIWLWITTGLTQRFFSPTATLPVRSGENYVFEISGYAGRELAGEFYFVKRGRGETRLFTQNRYLRFEPSIISASQVVTKVKLHFKTPYSGEYLAPELRLEVRDPLGFFERQCSIRNASFKFMIYPRVLEIAFETAKILGKGGSGDTPLNIPGIGTEPYEMRFFQSGDDTRQINWKASARMGRLVITERQKEAGSSFYIVLDAVALSPFDRDRLAAAFLELANSLAAQRCRFGILVHRGKTVSSISRIDEEDSQQNTLSFALRVALELSELKKPGLEDRLSALPSEVIKNNRDELLLLGLNLLSEIEESGLQNLRGSIKGEPFKTITKLVDEHRGDPPVILYVTGLCGPVQSIVEAGSYLKQMYDSELVVIDPTAPWVVAEDEESGARLYKAKQDNIEALSRANLKCYSGEPTRLIEELLRG